jgi:hypothetical protein
VKASIILAAIVDEATAPAYDVSVIDSMNPHIHSGRTNKKTGVAAWPNA